MWAFTENEIDQAEVGNKCLTKNLLVGTGVVKFPRGELFFG